MTKPFDYINDGAYRGIDLSIIKYGQNHPNVKLPVFALTLEELQALTKNIVCCLLKYPGDTKLISPSNIQELKEKYPEYDDKEIKWYAKYRSAIANVFIESIDYSVKQKHRFVTLYDVSIGLRALMHFNVPLEEVINFRTSMMITRKIMMVENRKMKK